MYSPVTSVSVSMASGSLLHEAAGKQKDHLFFFYVDVAYLSEKVFFLVKLFVGQLPVFVCSDIETEGMLSVQRARKSLDSKPVLF